MGKVHKDLKDIDSEIVWMHCASLGEFEQGKPVLQSILKTNTSLTPVISFFSPSGYEIVKKKGEFPYIYYLPMDSFVNARLWLKFVNPKLILWVKYEYWYFYLQAIQSRKIPLLMISGIYSRKQVFFRWYGGLYRKMLNAFTHFFVQNNSSKRYLATLIDKEKISISGDTRCDRVIEIAEHFKPVEAIDEFTSGYRVMVCGSTWEADEAIWVHYINHHPELRFIIAPHEIDRDNINTVKSKFKNCITYSDWISKKRELNHSAEKSNCLIIDNIGILSRLYHYATITYVGGGFGDNGLHNILEGAVYGKPVIFGPIIYKNFEASQLIEAGGGISIATAIELEDTLNELLTNTELLKQKSIAAREYVYKNAGASKLILKYISDNNIING